MDLQKFINLLDSSELFLSKIAGFSDPLEGGLTAIDFLNVTNDPLILDIALNEVFPVSNESSAAREDRMSRARDAQERVAERKFLTPFGEYPCDKAEQIFPACREWIYSSCWHASKHECLAMWKLYGGGRNSVSIFSSWKRLNSSFKENNWHDNCHLEKVRYLDYASESAFESPLSPFSAKSTPYSFEKEVRVLAWDSKADILSGNEESGIFIGVDLGWLIEKVVVSPYSDPWFKEVVEKICLEKGLGDIVENSSLRDVPVSGFYDAIGVTR